MADKSLPLKLVRKGGFKIIEDKGKPLDSERCLSVQSPKDGKPPTLMVQYRGNQSQYFANRSQKLTRSSDFHHKKTRIMFTITEVSIF